MNLNNLKACCAAALALLASVAQASITQSPALPAQVMIAPVSRDQPDNGFSLEALGTARLEGHQWVADVVEVEPGLFKLDADAGLRVRLTNPWWEFSDPITWKNFTIQVDPSDQTWLPYRVTADRYRGDELVDRVSFGSLSLPGVGDPFAVYDELPEGQGLLWHGHPGLVPSLADFKTYPVTAIYLPTAFATISVSAVPEPAVWQGLGLGLVGLMGLQAVRRRQRGAAASGVDQA